MELGPIHEAVDERFRVRGQQRFPTVEAHSHPVRHRPRVRHEVREVWSRPVRGPVESSHQSAGLPELNGQEEGRRNVLTTTLQTVLDDAAGATLEYLIAPEVEAGFVRFTAEEIKVVLAYEVLRRIQWIDQPAGRKRR